MEPAEFQLSNIADTGVPIAMFYAEDDAFSTVDDVEWLRDELGDAVVHYESIRGGHVTFLCAEDMSYLEDMIEVVKVYNPPTHEPIAPDGGDLVEEELEAAIAKYDELDW
jgi:dienelactone hydrolase